MSDSFNLSINELFEVGRFKNKLNKEQQEKHIKGTKRYIEGNGYFENSLKELTSILEEVVGTGERVLTNLEKPTNKERIKDSRIKGVYKSSYNKKLDGRSTDKIIISHSKTRYHAYPVKPDDEEV